MLLRIEFFYAQRQHPAREYGYLWGDTGNLRVEIIEPAQ